MSNRSFTSADFEVAHNHLEAVVSNNLRWVAQDEFRETPWWTEQERARMHAENAAIMKALYVLRHAMNNGVDVE